MLAGLLEELCLGRGGPPAAGDGGPAATDLAASGDRRPALDELVQGITEGGSHHHPVARRQDHVLELGDGGVLGRQEQRLDIEQHVLDRDDEQIAEGDRRAQALGTEQRPLP